MSGVRPRHFINSGPGKGVIGATLDKDMRGQSSIKFLFGQPIKCTFVTHWALSVSWASIESVLYFGHNMICNITVACVG